MRGYVKQIFEKRSLIWALSVTDLKLRYRNSVLGFFWTFLEPLLMLSVLYFVFSFVLPSGIENYPLFLLIGIITWNTFSRGTTMASNSILSRKGVIMNIFLPRMILPVSSVITSFLMMFFELLVFVAFLIAFQFIPPTTISLLPFMLIPLFLLILGISFSLSVLNVMYRDIGYIWAVIVQAGFFLTPIIYTIQMLPENIQDLILLNPMAHLVIWSQDFALYGKMPSIESIEYVFFMSIAIFIAGFFIFRKLENSMMDRL